MLNASVIWKHRARIRVNCTICKIVLQPLHPDTGVSIPIVKEKLCCNASCFLRHRALFHCGNRKGVERSIAPNVVPAKFHWQAICRIYAISFLIFMYVTCIPAIQSGGITLFFRTVEHMTKELTDRFHYRDDHMTNDRFQRSAVRMTEEPAY